MKFLNILFSALDQLGVRGFVIFFLLVSLGLMGWRTDSQTKRISVLNEQLMQHQKISVVSERSADAAAFHAANEILDTTVQRDALDESFEELAMRAEKLERETEDLRLQLIKEVNCVTPSKIRNASGL